MEETIKKKRYVNQLQVGEKVQDVFVASDAALIPFRPDSGKSGSFMRFSLSDQSGSLPAIMWEGGELVFPQLKQGVVVQIQGNVGQYRGQLQIIVERLELEPGAVDPACFLPQTSRSRSAMEQELRIALKKVQLPALRSLLSDLFEDRAFYQAFTQAPAAKRIHHAYLGGLLEHTLETVFFAEAIFAQYPQYINRDLLLTGALLHDCGKILEYNWQGLAVNLTDDGKLFGHLVLGAKLVDERINRYPQFPSSLRQELIHMILAHHGTEEWGSPQPPKTVNAFALHQADFLSAELSHFQSVLQKAEESDAKWSVMDRKLGRSLYRGFLNINEAAATREGDS
ncbi:MAG: 3'-5' exoribonuclease YhaM family protein [bacterium]|jgi:3'-5' exoribonuclease